MKKNQGVIIALAIACVLAIVFAVVYINGDRTGPVLTVDTSSVKAYSKDQGEETLVKYVKAIDAKDGDVSNTVIVESIYLMSDLKTAKVVYVARDKSNNVTKLDYLVDYIASEEEIQAKENINTVAQAETQSVSGSTAGTTAVQEKAGTTTETASETGTTKEATTTEAVTVEGGPKLVLTATEDSISAGSTFNIGRYISEITDDKDTADTMARRVIVNGNYSTATAGDYTLDVYCTDSDKNESNHVTFTLHVQ